MQDTPISPQQPTLQKRSDISIDAVSLCSLVATLIEVLIATFGISGGFVGKVRERPERYNTIFYFYWMLTCYKINKEF